MWELLKTYARSAVARRVASRGSESSASPMRYPRCSDGPNQGYTPPTRQQLLSTWGDDSQAVSPMEDSERLTIMSLSRPNTQHTAAGLPYDRDSELVATRRKIGGHERTLVPLYSRSSLAVRSAACLMAPLFPRGKMGRLITQGAEVDGICVAMWEL